MRGSGVVGSERSHTVRVVREAWEDVLGHSSFGDDDVFFDVGGSSLAALRLVGRLRSALRRELVLTDVYEFATVAEQAARSSALPVLPPEDESLDSRLSYGQIQELEVVRERRAAGAPPPPHNVDFLRHLVGPVDAAALDEALRATIRRQPSLRTTFDLDPLRSHVGELADDWHLETADLSASPSPWDAALADHERRAAQPFEPERPHLIRVKLYALGRDEHLLGCVLDHLVGDGVSSAVLWCDVAELYRAATEGGEPRLPPVAVSPQRLVALRDVEMDRHADERLAEWMRALRGYDRPPKFDIAPDEYDPAAFRPPVPATSYAQRLPERDAAAWVERARRAGVSGHAAALAMLYLALRRVTGEDDVVVVTSVEGRQSAEAEDVVGWFAYLLLVRCRPPREALAASGGAPDATAVARAIESELLASYRRALPFHVLLDHVFGPEGSVEPPVAWVQVDYFSGGAGAARLGKAEARGVDRDPEVTTFHGVAFEMSVDDRGLLVRASGPAERYPGGEIQALGEGVLVETRAFVRS